MKFIENKIAFSLIAIENGETQKEKHFPQNLAYSLHCQYLLNFFEGIEPGLWDIRCIES